MPGIIIHLAAANEYLKNHPDENKEEFLKGSIAPDFTGNSSKSHHSSPDIFDSALSFLRGKVNLKECVPDFDIKTPFGRGYFYHLITDDWFYGSLAKNESEFKSMSHAELKDKLYHDYASTNDFFKDRYEVIISDIAKKYDIANLDNPIIIKIDSVCDMIQRLGTLDLDEYLGKL